MRAKFDDWRADRDRAIAAASDPARPGEAYAALADGMLHLPPMPHVLRDYFALGDGPRITDSMDLRAVQEIYEGMADG
ncbi:hypothetical protein [Novosphingopyxis iocasae]|uniref:hypothetical protein n=1 Tax=Novosphingopyxis iocasae TaxID=2762729 RepID=UPI001651A888|nr:hypothetical protein [Novosphingopyxis iocasae]